MTVKIIMVLVIAEMVIVGKILFSCCYVLGYAFSNEKEAVDLLRIWSLLFVSQIITDGLLAVLSGVARGSGWQHIGAYDNFGACYLVWGSISCRLGLRCTLKRERPVDWTIDMVYCTSISTCS